jgi:hypothetical protein
MTETLSPMQAELLKRADSIFEGISSTVATGVDFAKEQVPDIAYQFITYSRVYLSVMMVITLIIFGISLWGCVGIGFRNTFKIANDRGGNWEAPRVFAMLGGFVLAVISGISALQQIKLLTLVWLAPKIFLIQEIVHLVKG